MGNGKTIKEIADQLHVTKQAVLKKVSSQERQLWFKKSGNKFIVSEEGEKAIISRFDTDFSNNIDNQNDNQNDSVHILVHDLVVDLKEDKNQLIQQIDELNNRLKDNQRLLDQQQRLSLQAQQRVEQLEKQLALEPPKHQEQTDQELESWQISEYETKIKSLENNLEETKEELQERDKVMRYLKQEYDIDSLDDLVEFAEGDSTRKWWQFWRR